MISVMLAYGSLAVTFLMAAVLAVSLIWLVHIAATRPEMGMLAALLAFLLESLFVEAPSINLILRLSSTDIVFMMLLIGSIYRILLVSTIGVSGALICVLGLATIVAIQLSFGLIKIGTKAGVEVRESAYFIAAMIYISSFDRNSINYISLWRYARFCAWVLVAIILYRWIGVKYGFVSEALVQVIGASSEYRVVGANSALYLAIISLGYLGEWTNGASRSRLLHSITLGFVVLVLQHRSVWIFYVLGGIAIIYGGREKLSRHGFVVASSAVVFGSLLIVVLILNRESRVVETLLHSLESMTDSKGTHVDRYLGWYELLGLYVSGGPRVWLAGFPYGSGYERWVMGVLRDYAPHNFYVALLIRTGLVGVFAFLLLHFKVQGYVNLARRSGAMTKYYCNTISAILFMSLIYYLPYQASYIHGIVYGLIISYFGGGSGRAIIKGSFMSVNRWSSTRSQA